MMRKLFGPATLAAAVCLAGGASAADDVRVTVLSAPSLPLSKVTFPNSKTITFDVGYGSGAVHPPFAPAGTIYTITDRGPNISCDEAPDIVGLDATAMCGGEAKSKIFPTPDFTPSIFELTVDDDGAVTVKRQIPLKGRSGKTITGVTNPLETTDTEGSWSNEGKALPYDASGLDTEALVAMRDGSFWIAEEYGGSIVHVAGDGTILARHVPAGLEGDLKDADYLVKGTLPSIIMKRKLNRGIESIAASPDEEYLYFAMQSPLCNPDCKAYKSSANVRFFKFDIVAEKVVGEYLYLMDSADSFALDNAKKTRKQNDVKISEMTAVGPDRLLVLERVSKTTKFYIVDLNGAVPVPQRFDDVATSPALELTPATALVDAGVSPLAKQLVLSTDDHKGFPSKVEGMAVIDPKTLVLLNDSDFGIDGKKTVVLRVDFPKPVLR